MARPPHVPQPETELEEFFDLSIDPMSIIGFDGEFKRVNASFVRLLGYTKPELFSRTALDILHPDDVEPAREALAQLAEGHDLVRFEARVICADGAVRWLEWNTRSMPERGVLYSVGRDTTERRRVEAELREAQRLLEAQSRRAAHARGGAGGAAARGHAGRAGRPVETSSSVRSRDEVGRSRGRTPPPVDPLRDRRHGDPHGDLNSRPEHPPAGALAPRAGSGVRRRRGPPDRAGRTTRHGRPGRLGHARGRPERSESAPRSRARSSSRASSGARSRPARASARSRPAWSAGSPTSRSWWPPRSRTPSPREALARLAEEQAALRRVATLVAENVPSAELFAAVAQKGRRSPRRGLRRHDPLRGRRDGHVRGHLGRDGGAAADSRALPDRAGRSDDDGRRDAPAARVDDWTVVPGPLAAFSREELGSALLGGQPDRGGGSVVGRPGGPLHGRRAPAAGHRVAHRRSSPSSSPRPSPTVKRGQSSHALPTSRRHCGESRRLSRATAPERRSSRRSRARSGICSAWRRSGWCATTRRPLRGRGGQLGSG